MLRSQPGASTTPHRSLTRPPLAQRVRAAALRVVGPPPQPPPPPPPPPLPVAACVTVTSGYRPQRLPGGAPAASACRSTPSCPPPSPPSPSLTTHPRPVPLVPPLVRVPEMRRRRGQCRRPAQPGRGWCTAAARVVPSPPRVTTLRVQTQRRRRRWRWQRLLRVVARSPRLQRRIAGHPRPRRLHSPHRQQVLPVLPAAQAVQAVGEVWSKAGVRTRVQSSTPLLLLLLQTPLQTTLQPRRPSPPACCTTAPSRPHMRMPVPLLRRRRRGGAVGAAGAVAWP